MRYASWHTGQPAGQIVVVKEGLAFRHCLFGLCAGTSACVICLNILLFLAVPVWRGPTVAPPQTNPSTHVTGGSEAFVIVNTNYTTPLETQ
ncbi:hypothetical protein GCM10010971_29190 [Silvimonas amylolytica]|uniref:Uncharacterized protein n=1 Tax=Silvimonas amylolytica TaxID=449663 RepID=A0ABQ2PNZ4_9NEIS|nr:hypothetical protein GCM10010971_29190 [Silvimonas amylolytica]